MKATRRQRREHGRRTPLGEFCPLREMKMGAGHTSPPRSWRAGSLRPLPLFLQPTKAAPAGNRCPRPGAAVSSTAAVSFRSGGRAMRTVTLAVLLMLVAAFPAVAPQAWAGPKATGVRAEVLAAVEDELTRLSQQAKAEAGPAYPRPSSEVAFLLLAGLAGRGTEVKRPTAEELGQPGITPSNRVRVQVFAAAEDARVVIRAEAIQDKSGYWTSKRATLYRRQGDQWVERGSGSTAVDGVSSTD